MKFYLHISPEEQLDRFRRRLEEKTRRWKIDEADYADRELWHRYMEANEDMLQRTSTRVAPWFVIPADHKWYRNFAVSKIVKKAMRSLNLQIPEPKVDIAEIRRRYHATECSA